MYDDDKKLSFVVRVLHPGEEDLALHKSEITPTYPNYRRHYVDENGNLSISFGNGQRAIHASGMWVRAWAVELSPNLKHDKTADEIDEINACILYNGNHHFSPDPITGIVKCIYCGVSIGESNTEVEIDKCIDGEDHDWYFTKPMAAFSPSSIEICRKCKKHRNPA